MPALADIFAAVRLQLDGTGFEAQATALADKQGKNVGDRMSQNLSASFKKAAAGLVGAGIGAAFGAMLAGANDLDAATRRLQADTGMTADEAKRAQGALASMYKDNLQGFDQIGEAMAKVHNDLGLTGDAADAMTAKFLKFSTATGQDAAQAVTQADDALDAWNMSAEDAGPLLDKLVAGHQKYGGSIADNLTSLARLAPAMQAMGASVDDTIGLLNLFNAAGLDAGKATLALNTAVKQLKPGEDINDLVAQITSIEDPTLRAQKAIAIFGARGGVGLANALRPGIRGLSDFTTSADENANAVDTAAAAVESGFGAQFTKLIHNAGGALAEFGTQFGPLLMVASAFGPSFLSKLGAGIGGIAGLIGPKLAGVLLGAAGEVTAASTVLGTSAGTAFAVAMAAAAIAVPIAVVLVAKGPLADWLGFGEGSGFGGRGTPMNPNGSSTVVPVTVTPDEEASAAAFREYLAGLPDASKGLDYSAWKAAGEKGGAAVVGGAVAGMAQGASDVQARADSIVAHFTAALEGAANVALRTGGDSMAALAQGITAARQKPLDAFDTMKQMLENAMTLTAEIARLKGELTSKELARGLKSGDPAVRAQAKAVAEMAASRLGQIASGSGKAGQKAMAELRAGMRSRLPEVRAASTAAYNAVVSKLQATQAPAAAAGAAAARAFVSKFKLVIKDGIVVQVRGGGVEAFAEGSWSVPATQLALVHRGEMIVPASTASAVRAGTATVGGGPTVNIGGITVNAGADTSLGAARRFGQAVLDEVAAGLREQSARFAGARSAG